MSSPMPTTFANTYDLDNPLAAMSSYSRLMHQHTKRQMDIATTAAVSRRSEGGNQRQMASEGSLDSVDSLEE
ncbi:hypothetical protein P7C71_g2548, partial [Lecanoromycetidae sp. Uapishka_2]